MKLSVCKCCGEVIPPRGDLHSRHPNLCASCSSMSDGMLESDICEQLQSENAASQVSTATVQPFSAAHGNFSK